VAKSVSGRRGCRGHPRRRGQSCPTRWAASGPGRWWGRRAPEVPPVCLTIVNESDTREEGWGRHHSHIPVTGRAPVADADHQVPSWTKALDTRRLTQRASGVTRPHRRQHLSAACRTLHDHTTLTVGQLKAPKGLPLLTAGAIALEHVVARHVLSLRAGSATARQLVSVRADG
jgi:hypothetical protein